MVARADRDVSGASVISRRLAAAWGQQLGGGAGRGPREQRHDGSDHPDNNWQGGCAL